MNPWAILWHIAAYVAEGTTFVAFVGGLWCLVDGPRFKVPRHRMLGALGLWLAVLAFVASIEFSYWARLAAK